MRDLRNSSVDLSGHKIFRESVANNVQKPAPQIAITEPFNQVKEPIMTDRIWRTIAILSLVVLLHISLRGFDSTTSGLPALVPPVHAGGMTVATDETETVLTASEDGKTIYMWQFYSSKPPKYQGKSEAILGE